MIVRFTFVLAATILFLADACHGQQTRPTIGASEYDHVMRECERLHAAFSHGDVSHARRALEELTRMLENSAWPSHQDFQARTLAQDFGRLFLLEQRAGREIFAEAYLTKMRYWMLRSSEIGLDGDLEIAAASLLFPSFTRREAKAFVNGWDKDGRPSYASELWDHPPQATVEQVATIRRLVGELNADDWKQRDAAREELVHIGRVAITTLRQMRPEVSAEAQQGVDLVIKRLADEYW
jgi:hypothetical protein